MSKEPVAAVHGILKANAARAVGDEAKALALASAPDIAEALAAAAAAQSDANAAQVDAANAQADADQALSDAGDASSAALQAQTTATSADLEAQAALAAIQFSLTIGPWEEVKDPDDHGAFVPVGIFENLQRESNWGARHVPFGNMFCFYLPEVRAGKKWALNDAEYTGNGIPAGGESLRLLVSDTGNEVRVETPAGPAEEGACSLSVTTGANKFAGKAGMVLTWDTSVMGALVKQDVHFRLRFVEVAA